MTRKDYVNIAAAILATQARIKSQAELAGVHPDNAKDQLRGVRRAAAHLCDFLASDNPRFNPAQFLTACGYGATTMNPRDPALDLRPLPEETVKVRGQDRELSEFEGAQSRDSCPSSIDPHQPCICHEIAARDHRS